MDAKQSGQLKAKKTRTALILLSVAIAFFVGMVLRHWK
ncbi:MAG TPA: cytochrome oxidase small assembly protein [Burkholderiales bacterium]|jgi:hypothetical protein